MPTITVEQLRSKVEFIKRHADEIDPGGIARSMMPGGPEIEIEVELRGSLDLSNVTLNTNEADAVKFLADPCFAWFPPKVRKSVKRHLARAMRLQRKLDAEHDRIHDLIKAEAAKVFDYESLAQQAIDAVAAEALRRGVTVPHDAAWSCQIGVNAIYASCDLCYGQVIYEHSPDGGRVTDLYRWHPERTQPLFSLTGAAKAAAAEAMPTKG